MMWTLRVQVNSESELALKYNDRSPMENHHVAAVRALCVIPCTLSQCCVSQRNETIEAVRMAMQPRRVCAVLWRCITVCCVLQCDPFHPSTQPPPGTRHHAPCNVLYALPLIPSSP